MSCYLIVLTALTLLSSTFSAGGFSSIQINKKDPFLMNSIELTSQYIKDESDYEVKVNTLYVERQVVNGFKYKLLSFVRSMEHCEIDTTVVYTGTFGKRSNDISDYKVLSNVKTQLKEVNLSKEKLIQVRKLIRDVSDEREATSIQLYKIRDKFIIVFKLDGIEMPSLIIASELNDKQLFLEYYEN